MFGAGTGGDWCVYDNSSSGPFLRGQNGFWEDRYQIVAPSDTVITERIDRTGPAQVTVKNLLGHPEDPSGMGLTTSSVCSSPAASVARARTV